MTRRNQGEGSVKKMRASFTAGLIQFVNKGDLTGKAVR